MTVLGGGSFLIEVETAPNVWAECGDLTRVQKSNNVTISRTRVFRKTYRAASATDFVYTLNGLLNYADPGQSALLAAERANTSIRVRWTENEENAAMKMITARVATITHDATPAPGELQTISFELRSAVAPTDFSILPTTPAGLKSVFNQLGVAQMTQLYVKGVNQTVAAGKCTSWDDAVSPGLGKHFRPSPEVPAGANVAGDGAIIGQGLELPGSAELSGGAALADPTSTSDAAIPGSGGLIAVGSRNDTGIFHGAFGKMKRNIGLLQIGETGASNTINVDMRDPNGQAAITHGALAGLDGEDNNVGDGTGGTPPMHYSVWASKMTGGFNGTQPMVRLLYGRDIVMDRFYDSSDGDPTAAGRRVRLMIDGGWTASADNALSLYYIGYGRPNAAQIKLINDYCEQWLGAGVVWQDPRANIFYLFGDSFQPNAGKIQLGENGSPVLPNCAAVSMARSGNTPQTWQFPFGYFLRDCDFSRRTRVIVMAEEYGNGGTPDQNGFWLQTLKAINPSKVHTVHYNFTYNNAANFAHEPAYSNAIAANLLTVWGADGLIDFLASLMYDPYHKGDLSTSYPPGNKAILWDGASNHPSSLAQEYFTAFYRGAAFLGGGVDDSAIPFKIDPTNGGGVITPSLALSAGTPTGSVTWVVKNRTGGTIAGRTLGFSSLDTGIATVHPTTGVVTRVAAGRARIKVVTDIGGVGVLGVEVS